MSSAISLRSVCVLAISAIVSHVLSAQISIEPEEAGEVIGSNVFIDYAGSTSGVSVTVTSIDSTSIGTISVKVTGPSNGWLTLNVECDGSLFSITKDVGMSHNHTTHPDRPLRNEPRP